MSDKLLGERSQKFLVEWYGQERHRRDFKPSSQFERVADLLRRNPDDLSEYIAMADEVENGDKASSNFPLDEESAKVVRVLKSKHPQLLTTHTIHVDADISLATTKDRLRKLIDAGYAHRPNGKNTGAGLTSDGLDLAASLPAPQSARS